MGIFSFLKNIIWRKREQETQITDIQNEETEETKALRLELERHCKILSDLVKKTGQGHREQRRNNAEYLEEAIKNAEEFCVKNPNVEITNIDKVKNLANNEKCITAPLYKTSRDDTYFVCLLDTETTGIGDDDEPISVAVMLVEVTQNLGDHIREIDRYVGLREAGVKISERAFLIHGISDNDIRGKSLDFERLHSIIDSADVIVAHNADFDHLMMSKIMPSIVEKTWACSMDDLWWAWKEINGGRKGLDSICHRLGIEKAEKHDAMGDIEALYKVLQTRTGKTVRSRTLLQPLLKKALKEYGEL